MSKIEIFEPAMCCETGLCGVSVDPELLRISTAINTLRQNDIVVERYNLSGAPQAFVDNQLINDFINKYGAENLPVTLLDGKVKAIGHYPSNKDFTKWLDLPAEVLGVSEDDDCCCCDEDCCCDEGCCDEGCCCDGDCC